MYGWFGVVRCMWIEREDGKEVREDRERSEGRWEGKVRERMRGGGRGC